MKEIIKAITKNKILAVSLAIIGLITFFSVRKRLRADKLENERLKKSLENFTAISQETVIVDEDGTYTPNPLITPTITTREAKSLCARVIEDCKWFHKDLDVYTDLSKLSDVNLIKVCNVWAVDFAEFNEGLKLSKYISDNKLFTSRTIKDLVARIDRLTK